MHGEVEHLQRLVEDLRVLSLADAGELPLNRRAVDPSALLERTGLAYIDQAEQQGITLRVEPDRGAALDRGGHRPHDPGVEQPGLERAALHARGWRDHAIRGSSDQRRLTSDRRSSALQPSSFVLVGRPAGARYRQRHRGRRSAVYLRPLLPRRPSRASGWTATHPGWAWRSPRRSSRRTAARWRSNRARRSARPSRSRCRPPPARTKVASKTGERGRWWSVCNISAAEPRTELRHLRSRSEYSL